jgi:4-methoxybenzoate monooxygenase (O-demethylating)
MTGITSTVPAAPAMDDDPFSDNILADPYDFHRRLRDTGPVIYLPSRSVYAMGRYEEVRDALGDWATFVSSRGAGLADFTKEVPWRPPSLLLEADPPDHTVVRQAVGAVLSPRAIRGLRDSLSMAAQRVVDTLVERGSFDVVTDLAERYPLEVFPDMVGLPVEGRENLLAYGSLAFNAFGPHNHLLAAALTRAAPVQDWIRASCQRDSLAPGGLGAQIWDLVDQGQITAEQAPMLVRSLLSAGVDTTVYGIANTLYALAAHPAQWDRLRADPSLAKVAFDEALRWESPVQTFFRTTSRDVEVSGTLIPKDNKVLLFLGSANRDPRHWGDDAETFALRGRSGGHVAFGRGVHQCVGQPIARLEVEALLEALTQRVEALELVGSPEPKLNNTLKGWAHIPVRVTVR